MARPINTYKGDAENCSSSLTDVIPPQFVEGEGEKREMLEETTKIVNFLADQTVFHPPVIKTEDTDLELTIINEYLEEQNYSVPQEKQPLTGFCNAGQPLNGLCNAGQPLNVFCNAGQPINGFCNAGQPLNVLWNADQPLNGLWNAGQPLNGLWNSGQPFNGIWNAGQPFNGFNTRQPLIGDSIDEKPLIGDSIDEKPLIGDSIDEKPLNGFCNGKQLSNGFCNGEQPLNGLCNPLNGFCNGEHLNGFCNQPFLMNVNSSPLLSPPIEKDVEIFYHDSEITSTEDEIKREAYNLRPRILVPTPNGLVPRYFSEASDIDVSVVWKNKMASTRFDSRNKTRKTDITLRSRKKREKQNYRKIVFKNLHKFNKDVERRQREASRVKRTAKRRENKGSVIRCNTKHAELMPMKKEECVDVSKTLIASNCDLKNTRETNHSCKTSQIKKNKEKKNSNKSNMNKQKRTYENKQMKTNENKHKSKENKQKSKENKQKKSNDSKQKKSNDSKQKKSNDSKQKETTDNKQKKNDKFTNAHREVCCSTSQEKKKVKIPVKEKSSNLQTRSLASRKKKRSKRSQHKKPRKPNSGNNRQRQRRTKTNSSTRLREKGRRQVVLKLPNTLDVFIIERQNASHKFWCSACTYKSNMRHQLHVHVRRHIGLKPYNCNFCDYRSVEKSHVIRHVKIHTGDRPHKCPYCPYASIQKTSLKAHTAKCHNV